MPVIVPRFPCHYRSIRSVNHLECMAGTTGLEPATSAVTGQRSNQLSYVPRLFFNNLVICHVESSVSQLSLSSLFSTVSLLSTQFWRPVNTTWTPKPAPQRQDQVYQKRSRFGVHVSPVTEQKDSLPLYPSNAAGRWCWCDLGPAPTSRDLMGLGMGVA